MTRKATTWNSCYPDDPMLGLLHLEPPALSGEESFSVHCSGGTSEEKDEVASRLTALWNAAEELELTTEKIEDGEIQAIFFRNQEQSKLIAAAPDMLEALEEVMGELDFEGLPCPLCGRDLTIGHRHKCLWHVVNAAIKKARGEE